MTTVRLNRKGIAGWLRRHGWSRHDLAVATGLSDCAVAWALKWQDEDMPGRDKRGPAFETVWRIHRATGIDYDHLIREVEE